MRILVSSTPDGVWQVIKFTPSLSRNLTYFLTKYSCQIKQESEIYVHSVSDA